ncbi:PP2C family protein-serine/threonine phosphatase [Thermococcus aciditolerans]|uniref:Serine/threonine-protein phosphatase n=1 Tax=Thermococcus aciditolerans TaxID=2598455 RepID=A0A5C0SI78_9EURY|nr:protein phosphatase 2C domain-containing protein [Thermococcus aciditolerans]QEK14163.1 serine/threonine-protein phosphatase [Thermococcus aciditolerans]
MSGGGISCGVEGRVWGISHPGGREENEDAFLVLPLGDGYLLAVADGLGGHSGGELAARTAVETLSEVFEENYREELGETDVERLLRMAYETAHRRILDASKAPGRMGTTLVSTFVRNGKAVIANTGDSRACLVRDGKIIARTRDHSVVQGLLERGVIGEEEVKRHPMRHVVTKALGVDLEVDTYVWEMRTGDVLVLSSDGLHDYLDDGIIEKLTMESSPKATAEALIGEALKVTEDNVTVVVFREV